MIPNHLLDDLGSEERIAILANGRELHFVVHRASDSRARIRVDAERDGSELLATHLLDLGAIRAFVASREPDLGGEG